MEWLGPRQNVTDPGPAGEFRDLVEEVVHVLVISFSFDWWGAIGEGETHWELDKFEFVHIWTHVGEVCN